MSTTEKPVAWSHSALTSFETCPRRHYLIKVVKKVKEKEGEALQHGKVVHTQLENRLKDGMPLPPHLVQFEPLVSRLLQKKGTPLVECQWAVDKSFNPVAWYAKSVWCRAVVDAGIVNDTAALLLDWKTGKRKLDSDQLKLSAGMTFAQYPKVQTVVTGFVWLGAGKMDTETYQRAQIGDIWGAFLPRVARLEAAYKEQKWEPRPSGLCRNYCPVPKAQCEFSGWKSGRGRC